MVELIFWWDVSKFGGFEVGICKKEEFCMFKWIWFSNGKWWLVFVCFLLEGCFFFVFSEFFGMVFRFLNGFGIIWYFLVVSCVEYCFFDGFYFYIFGMNE